jgi:hypothetical protein
MIKHHVYLRENDPYTMVLMDNKEHYKTHRSLNKIMKEKALEMIRNGEN